MLLLVASAIASAAPQTPPSAPGGASAQARVAIRVISGVRLHFGERTNGDFLRRDTVIRSADGVEQPAKLIEFQ